MTEPKDRTHPSVAPGSSRRAKYTSPRGRVDLVFRSRLIEKLDQALSLRLCVLTAPAGFGKTTLLMQWRDHLLKQDVKVAWFTVDEEDSDPRLFLSSIVDALRSAGIDVGQLTRLAGQGLIDLSTTSVVGEILDVIIAERGPVVLMFDDYHRAQGRDVDQILNRLLELCPENFTIALDSRAKPSLILPRLLAAGEAIEIDAEMLRFSWEETQLLLADTNSDARQLEIYERTEGWAIALQLAKLAPKAAPNATIVPPTKPDEHFATYLTDQILAEVPDDLREFMLRTSVLDRFNASLANTICDRADAVSLLQRLRPLNSLLVPLDERHEWFRYHHLVAECLQAQLWQVEPEIVPALYERASRWFEKDGDITEAVRYASKHQDFSRCATLIEDAGGWELVLHGGIGYLRNLLRHIPEIEAKKFPRILAAKAYLAMKLGNRLLAQTLLNEAKSDRRTAEARNDATAGLGRDLFNIELMWRVYRDEDISIESLERIRNLSKCVSPHDDMSRGMVLVSEAMCCQALGRLDDAEAACVGATRAMRQAGSVLAVNYCLIHSAITAMYRGDFDLAASCAEEAGEMAQRNFGADGGLKSNADIINGIIPFWQDEWELGEADRFRSALDNVQRRDGWFAIYAEGLSTAVASALALGEDSYAQDSIRASQHIADVESIERLGDLASAHRLTLLMLRSEPGVAQLAQSLERKYGLGCWRERPNFWRPYVEIGVVLAEWYRERDRARSLQFLDDVISCCQNVGARFFEIRAQVAKAATLEGGGRRKEAMASLLSALRAAARCKTTMPFRANGAIRALLHATLKARRGEEDDQELTSFIEKCLSVSAFENAALLPATALFSQREQQVLVELVNGQSNKEIARTLDLTEHTVKYHLRNIFLKLKVERRNEAVSVVQKLYSTKPLSEVG